jgi:hypothetical protein
MKEQNGKAGDLVMLEDFAHTAEKLEFGAVLDLVAVFARSDRSKRAIRASRPAASPGRSAGLQEETVELIRLIDGGVQMPLSGWHDAYDLVDAAKAEGHLYTGEELVLIAHAEVKASEVSRFLAIHAERLPHLSTYRDAFAIQGDITAGIARAIGLDYEFSIARARSSRGSARSSARCGAGSGAIFQSSQPGSAGGRDTSSSRSAESGTSSRFRGGRRAASRVSCTR